MNKYNFKTSNVAYPILLIVAIALSLLFYGFYSGKINFVSSCDKSCSNIAYWAMGIIAAVLYIAFVKYLLMLTGIGYYYTVEEDGVVATMFFMKKKFLFSEMKEYYKLDQNQVGDLTYRINNNLLDYSNYFDIAKQWNLGWKQVKLGKYSGVMLPVGQQDTIMQLGNSPISFPVYMKAIKFNPKKGDYVLLMMKNGEMFILSPKDIDNFVKEMDSASD